MKLTLTLILLSISSALWAQGTQAIGTASATLDVTNIKPSVLTGGDMFSELQTPTPVDMIEINPKFEVPKGSGKHTIGAGALWLAGKDASGQVYTSSQTYRQNASPVNQPQAGYWPGPIGNSQTLSHNAVYDKIWKISKIQIQNHIVNYNTSGYVIPPDIASWPGNGNIANGEAAQLAPYPDINNDGVYSPNLGDYPIIKGDQALYLILNDKGNVKEPASPTMNMEIHAMFYGFNDPANPAVYNTLFSQYRIINRGLINFKDFYAGIWVDFDLGNWNDDYIGCDTTTNRFFVYNSDNFDQDSFTVGNSGQSPYFFANGYGANPPVQSVTFLDHKMSHFMFYLLDNHPVNGIPRVPSDFYNYLRGHWKNNMPITTGGIGYNPLTPSAPASEYMFPGNPDTQAGWSEVTAGNNLSDRRGIGSIGPYNLPAGQ